MRIELLGREQVKAALTRLVKGTQARVVTEVGRATRGTKAEARDRCPKAFGKLRSSIRLRYSNAGKIGEVYVGERYGQWVEGIWHKGIIGRAKGKWPPIEPILAWVRKLGIASSWNVSEKSATYMVRRKIGKKGTPAQPFLGPAFFAHAKLFQLACKKIIARAAREAGFIMKAGGA